MVVAVESKDELEEYDTLWFLRPNQNEKSHNCARVVHTDRHCQHMNWSNSTPEQVDAEYAMLRDLDLCAMCVDARKNNPPDPTPCPICGEPQQKLANHIHNKHDGV